MARNDTASGNEKKHGNGGNLGFEAELFKAAENKDEYLADNVFWVPKEARWSHLQANAKLPTIGSLIDDAMRAIEKDNESLKGVLPKDYARPALGGARAG
jgi:type I restriction enzyme M protein